MIQEWLSEHEDKLKVASLIVASLVLFISIYRWLLQRWRADVSLRKYAFLHSLNREVSLVQSLKIDVPLEQELELKLIRNGHENVVLYKDRAPSGTLEIELNMNGREIGDYELLMTTSDQTTLKKIFWSGRD
ncbi:MAG: hypothetical protein HKN45_04490 [Flavobacteriales bacterium]|nr:hypothetical protein [Flavobacteriales bacterium]NNK80973.1 hypothetical protein [Flavobacteriales bacterium]